MTELPRRPAPRVPPATDAAVVGWMQKHGWTVLPVRWESDPETGFHVWQEDEPRMGRSHALWIAESMVRDLSAPDLIAVLENEEIAQEIRISSKVRIEGRGDGYRVSVVPRPSGEMKQMDL